MTGWNGRCQLCGTTTRENVERCIQCVVDHKKTVDARQIETFILQQLTHNGQHDYCAACAAESVKKEGIDMNVNHATDAFVDSEGRLTEKGREALAEYGESLPHYHVVEFINGCLNDYDSGPIESLDEARATLTSMAEEFDVYEPAGVDRYTRGIYILKIEECRETECEEGDY